MKRACTSICLLVLFFGFGSVAMSIAYSTQEKEYWLFLGNSGAGKSTIINSLLQKEVAESGPSIGGGLTKDYALYPNSNGNIVYIDTPELDDLNTRAEAAKEIEKALKQDGKYRIFFIMKTDCLIVRLADLAIIEIILDAINVPNIAYNIIVNQVTKRDQIKLNADPKISTLLHSHLRPGKYKNSKIRFINLDNAVLDGISDFLNMEGFLSFVNVNSNSMYLPKDSISTINGQSWDQKLTQVKSDLQQAKIDNEMSIF